MFFLGIILPLLFWIVVIIGGIFFAVRWSRRKHGPKHHEWHKTLFFSKEDALSQIYYLIGMSFSLVALSAINRSLGHPVSWQSLTLLVSVACLVIAYWQRILLLLPVGLIGIVSWFVAQSVEWMDLAGRDVRAGAIFVGVMCMALTWYAVGRAHQRYEMFRRFAVAYTFLGLFFVTAAFFLFSTTYGLQGIEELTRGASIFASAPLSIVLFLFIIAAVAAMIYAVLYRQFTLGEVIGFIIALSLIVWIGLSSDLELVKSTRRFSSVGSDVLTSAGIIWAALMNIVVFAQLVGFIFLGYHRHEEGYINAGAILMLIFIFIKYFDWFFTFLDKSLFFIISGVLLFLLGWIMERGRRMMIAKMKLESSA